MSSNTRDPRLSHGPRRLWVEQDDGTFFEVGSRQSVSVERYNRFVTTLPEGAKIIPKPPMVNHSPSDLNKIQQMKAQYDTEFPTAKQKETFAYQQTMALLDHPTLNFKQKMKKIWALRRQFKDAIHSKSQADVLLGKEVVDKMAYRQPRDELISESIAEKLSPEGAANVSFQMSKKLHERFTDHKMTDERLAQDATLEVTGWLTFNRGCTKLQANECSRLHKMIECMEKEVGHYPAKDIIHSFVVKHDWLAAVGASLGTVREEEIKLPFPMSSFEFKMMAKPVTVICTDLVAADLGNGIAYQYFIEAKNGFWVPLSENLEMYGFMTYLRQQIAAISVMLDSKIAEYETITQPPRLQEKRKKSGRLPLFDYHVVDLAKKYKKPSIGTDTGIKQRFHLRRGHWVHADERPRIDTHRPQDTQRWEQTSTRWRTWVNWYMAGDPDLGFINKEYKL